MGATALAVLLLIQPATGLAATADHPALETLLANAQSWRDAQAWPQALAALRLGQQQFPQEVAFQLGEIYVLTDAGHTEQAIALAAQLLQRHPEHIDALRAMGYAQLRHEGVFASLEYMDRAQLLAAGARPDVLRDYIRALQRAQMSAAALEIAQRYPGLLDIASVHELQADALAERVRSANLPTRSEAERFSVADMALAQYQALFAQWQKDGDASHAIQQRVRMDRLQALHARFDMDELIQEYEALVAEGVEVPNYALGPVAAAYLYLRKPEQSAPIYQRLIASGYMRSDAASRQNQDFGLLYAYADQGDVATSQQEAQRLQADYPQWRYVEGDQAHIPNAAFLDAHHTATMMDFYASAIPQAQHNLEQMVRAAPNNSNLRTDLVWLYRSRGWPRKAEQELKVAEAYDARGLGVEVGQGLTALDLQEWHQAKALSADMQMRFPEDRRSQRLARLWQVHNMAALQVNGYKGLSDNNPVSGGRDFGLEATLYSPPLAYHWRLLAGAGHRRATFDNSQGEHHFGRVGLEWRSRDWSVMGEVASNQFGHGNRSSTALTVDYSISDAWSVHVGAQQRARDTSLDALRNNVTSNRVDLGLQWRQSERRAWHLSITPSDFSDGNRRWDILLMGQERLWTRPTWFIDAGVELFTTRNRRSNVSYYSPRQESSVLPTLTWNHTIHQRYETVWTQQASLGIGSVQQSGYGADLVHSLSYGQRYKSNDTLELGGTLSTLSRPYDGRREREWRLVFDMTFRF